MSHDPRPACHETHCITCGDDGDAMRVLKVDEGRALALCADDGGEHHTVQVDLVSPVRPGDELLVHAGVALVLLAGDEVAS